MHPCPTAMLWLKLTITIAFGTKSNLCPILNTFDLSPLIVFFTLDDVPAAGQTWFARGNTVFGIQSGSGTSSITWSEDGKQVSWFGNTSAIQLNTKQAVYHWVAIG